MASNLEIGNRATVITRGQDLILTLVGVKIVETGREFLCRWTVDHKSHEKWIADCWLEKVSIEGES